MSAPSETTKAGAGAPASGLAVRRRPQIFTINTRSNDSAAYWREFAHLTALTDAFDLDGVLCFSANETLTDPWMAAQHLIANSRRLLPIVAVNPMYMHPFSAAKMVSSLAYMHNRAVALNLIVGASTRDRHVMGDEIGHADRYARLGEYARIVARLLGGEGAVDFEGVHYRLNQAVLTPQPPPDLRPRFLVAGHSEAALRLADETGAVRLRMLDPQLEAGVAPSAGGQGIHLGLIARADAEEAWAAARARFPVRAELEGLLDYVMEENDSVWKTKLYRQIKAQGAARPGYWLEPFGRLEADCPYFVGSYDEIAESLSGHVDRGVEWIIVDLPAEEAEFRHCAEVLSRLNGPRLQD